MPIGIHHTVSYHRSKSGFWASPTEKPVKPFDSAEFKQEFNDYIERKRNEDRWYKITWFSDKETFKTEIFALIDRYDEAKRNNSNVDYFRDKIAAKFKKTAQDFGGIRAEANDADGSEMSKILMKWYYRIMQDAAQQQNVNRVTEKQSPRHR